MVSMSKENHLFQSMTSDRSMTSLISRAKTQRKGVSLVTKQSSPSPCQTRNKVSTRGASETRSPFNPAKANRPNPIDGGLFTTYSAIYTDVTDLLGSGV